jgi:hypothetical protein
MSNKKFYFMRGGGEVLEVREMTQEEAEKAFDEANDATDGNIQWSSGFTASELHERLFGIARPWTNIRDLHPRMGG